MTLLALNGLRFERGQRDKCSEFALNVDLEISSPVTGIFGPSGAGKTTLLEIIAGLRKPAKGAASIGDRVLFDIARKIWVPPEKRRIGYVPQDLALFPHKTVRENLFYGTRQTAGEFDHVVAEFALEPLLARYPSNLSGGEKQRVAIGRALMTQPSLLMLDEPLSSLDPTLKERGLDLFRRVRDEFRTPILYVTHDATEIAQLCSHVIVLRSGHMETEGKPGDVFTETAQRIYSYRSGADLSGLDGQH